MRILYLCHRVPFPPNKGEKIRAFNQLKALSARHTVDLFTLADDPADLAHKAALEDFCASVSIRPLNRTSAKLRSMGYILGTSPLTIPFFRSRQLQLDVRKALSYQLYDRIFVYCSAMAQYAEAPEIGNIPLIVDLVDVDSDKWRQYAGYAGFPYSWVYRREAMCLANYEKAVCARASAVVVTTAREADLVRKLHPQSRVFAIGNGVDQDFFRPADDAPAATTPTICLTGDMSYFPNEQAAIFFASQVLPLIRERVPDARFLIIGRQPTRKVRELGKMPNVEVTGSVPDVRPFLARSQVSVAPFLIAAGIQNKVLEALSYRLPVVASKRIGASLPASVAELIEFADSAPEFASKVLSFLADPVRRERVGADSRLRVGEAYSWGTALAELMEVVERCGPPTSGAGFEPALTR